MLSWDMEVSMQLRAWCCRVTAAVEPTLSLISSPSIHMSTNVMAFSAGGAYDSASWSEYGKYYTS